MSTDGGRGIQSIEVGNRLLLALMKSGSPMMLRDLALEADIGAAQAHAYLTSFRRVELVEQEASSGKYILGPATNRLASARMETFQPMAHINDAAPKFAHSLGVMLALLVWGPTAPTAYRVHDASNVVNTNMRPGTTFSVTQSAAGRIFAAFDASPAVAHRLQEELAAQSTKEIDRAATSKAEFDQTINSIRADGYACVNDSPVPGLTSIAAPVLANGNLVLVAMIIGSNSTMKARGPDSPRQALLKFTGHI